MEPKIGQDVYFYRDRDFPSKRGPYSAKITAIVRLNRATEEDFGDSDEVDDSAGPSTVNLQVVGDLGGFWHEMSIPFLTSQFEDPGTRYCTPVPKE